MTPHQRACMKKCGQVWFLDTKQRFLDTCAIINQDGKHDREVAAHGCVCNRAEHHSMECTVHSIASCTNTSMCCHLVLSIICQDCFAIERSTHSTVHSIASCTNISMCCHLVLSIFCEDCFAIEQSTHCQLHKHIHVLPPCGFHHL